MYTTCHAIAYVCADAITYTDKAGRKIHPMTLPSWLREELLAVHTGKLDSLQACHVARLADAATLAAQSMPRQDGGLAASLWDMFSASHRPI